MKKILSVCILIAMVLGLLFIVFNVDKTQPKISGAVIPHHNIVAKQRQQFFTQLAQQIGVGNYPETIILVSPNHYNAGFGKIQTSNQDWELSVGSINHDADVVSGLISEIDGDKSVATNEPGSFADEHGIYNILGDIHNTFPDSKIVPIILKDPSQAELVELQKSLAKTCNNCLMLASVDFSHYQPASIAELHDQKTIRGLQNLDTNDVLKNAEVDSGASLALLMLWAKANQTMRFNLANHTNSSLLLNDPSLEGTSHVFGWYQAGRKVRPDQFTSFVITKNSDVGVENRAIWGTDLVVNQPLIDSNDPNLSFDKVVVFGKLTNNGIDLFGFPVDPNDPTKLLTKSELSFDNLSSSIIKSKIKLLINQNNERK